MPPPRVGGAPPPPGAESRVLVHDDGSHPDAVAGDHVWTAPVLMATEGPVEVTIQFGEETRSAEALVDDQGSGPLLFLDLGRRGLAVAVERSGTRQGEEPTEAAAGDTVSFSSEPWDGRVQGAMAILAAGLALLAGLLGGWWLRGRTSAPRVAEPGESPAIPPVRLRADQVNAVLAGPLSSHRVLVLGDPSGPPGAGVQRAETGLLPQELAESARDLASRPGRPVALLIMDASLLDRSGPEAALHDLHLALRGRLALWAVDGPEPWSGWPL